MSGGGREYQAGGAMAGGYIGRRSRKRASGVGGLVGVGALSRGREPEKN